MPTQSPLAEAEAAVLNKQSKLELARQAALTQDLAELARADREKVRRLEEQKLFGGQRGPGGSEGDPVGDIIVCDDYRRNEAPRPAARIWPAAVTAALAGALPTAALAAVLLRQPPPQQQPAPAPPAKAEQPPAPPPGPCPPARDWDAIYEEKQPDGSWKQIKRERLRPGE